MEIKSKTTHDPITDWGCLNAYMRWTLLEAEEIAGPKGLETVLHTASLEKFIGNYPPEDFKVDCTMSEYAALCAGLLQFFGSTGRNNLIRIGRKCAQRAMIVQKEQLGLDYLAAASRPLPDELKLKAGVEALIAMWIDLYRQVGGHWQARSEDRGDHLTFSVEACTDCVGLEADRPICYVWTGLLLESVAWQMGKEHDIYEIECRALGAPACVWEISKRSKE